MLNRHTDGVWTFLIYNILFKEASLKYDYLLLIQGSMHQTNIFQKFAKNELDYSAINNALCAFGNIKFDLVDVFEKKKKHTSAIIHLSWYIYLV